MGVSVKAVLGTTKYYTEVTAGENKLITDEPFEKGGENRGFNPFEILATSLASCTAATLRSYIDRKQWEVEKINIEVNLEKNPETKTTVFTRTVSYGNANLDADQLQTLRKVADTCPVHKILNGNIEVNTNYTEQ
ncbi:OsmC family protein [Kaistella sp. DKR-2]|uniref:OsmC family protein n=1 Tax=Kaistella soli TaxID=2849654 RepID=UPI001C2805CC|nr:OsmC family protein [Kaistella soli]MBU8882925.1 OsmC family protein [Kaistella soli]